MLTKEMLKDHPFVVSADEEGAVSHTQVDVHYKVTANQNRGHKITASRYPGCKSLVVTAGNDTVYLPYFDDAITSVTLPDSGPTLFVTDNMSGCALFLGKNSAGKLVAFHANSQTKSKEKDLKGKAVNFQHKKTKSELATQLTTARSAVQVEGEPVGSCWKADYLGGLPKKTKTQDFLGGTTIVGFREGSNWEFWYQTWGSVNKGATKVHDVGKWYP